MHARTSIPLRVTAIVLFAAAALIIASGATVAARVGPGTNLATTPTPAAPPGIEAPLGRYDESGSPLPLSEARSAPANLVSNANAPAVSTGFAGVGQEIDDNSFLHTPPDTHAAVGPDSIVEVTNGHVAIYDKTGSIIAGGDSGAGAVDLGAFCGNDDCFDPKVIYDPEAQRFVAVVLEGRTSADSFLHIMVSQDASPANLTTDWDKFRQASGTNITSPGWFDYPGLGVSPDAVVVAGNIFRDSDDEFDGTKIRVFDKTELYDGDTTATFIDVDRDLGTGGATIRPALHFGNPPANTFYLMQRWDSTLIAVTTLTGVPGSPTASATFLSTFDQGPCVDLAPQQGTAKVLDTVCPRMMNTVWRDGSIWGTLTGSDSTDARTVVQWFEVETNDSPANPPSVRQHGAIDGGVGEFTFMPSISVDSCGNAALTYTQTSASRFPEMRYTGRLAGDSLNSMQSPVVAKASAFFFDDFAGLPDDPFERWGDYSATAIDPSDQSFWVAHEYARVAATGAENDGRWGTWLANFTFGCGGPTPTPSATPTGPTATPTTTPTATNTPERPDLVVIGIDVSPAKPQAGEPVDVTVEVSNVGQAAAGPFVVDFYADLPGPPALGQFGEFFCSPDGLAAGATFECSESGVYNDPGSFDMWAQVDTDEAVAETNEGNNILGPQKLDVNGATPTPTLTPTATFTPTPTATPTPTPTITPTATPIPLFGDADGNEVVNAIDALWVLWLGAGVVDAVARPDNADVNLSGFIDSVDAALILQFLAGLLGTLPP